MPSTESNIVTSVNTQFTGMHIHSPDDPSGTLMIFPYGGAQGRGETVSRSYAENQFVGREYPVYDFGYSKEQSLSINTTVGYEEGLAHEKISKIRDMARSGIIYLYRDGRQRKIFGIMEGLQVDDQDLSYGIKFNFLRGEFSEGIA